MLYPFSISIDPTWIGPGRRINKSHFAGLVEANSKDEALGKATRIMENIQLIGALAEGHFERHAVVGEPTALNPDVHVVTLG